MGCYQVKDNAFSIWLKLARARGRGSEKEEFPSSTLHSPCDDQAVKPQVLALNILN
jgi:hypothetical protein